MYLRTLKLSAIRAFDSLEIEFPAAPAAGWHVILGDNGSGKSTLIRSLALGLAGPDDAKALRQPWSDWLRRGEERGSIEVAVERDPGVDALTGRGPKPANVVGGSIELRRVKSGRGDTVEIVRRSKPGRAARTIWGKGRGWFSASFGPYRRFGGGNREWDRVFLSNPKLAPHLSVFGEDVALTEALAWLQEIHVKRLEKDPQATALLDDLVKFINESAILPHATRVDEVTSDGVFFIDAAQCRLPVDQLSDGFRSILSLTFELLRLLVRCYGPDAVFRNIRKGTMAIDLPGVVAIDEIDAHLHPAWQREIGPWFLRTFPQIQFIITTHSPIICQAAEHGSVWRLPTPGMDGQAQQVAGEDLKKLVLGNVLDAFDTDLFGAKVALSNSARSKLAQLAKLNRRLLTGSLTKQEEVTREKLREELPSGTLVQRRKAS
jgi:energy-coupling factor transporter ATP-binding protein EcfA2